MPTLKQLRTVLPSLPAGPAQTVCLITEAHSSLLCRGHYAPPACYHTDWELNHPPVCVHVCERDRKGGVCSKGTLVLSPRGNTSKQRWLSFQTAPVAPFCSLSVLISLPGRCRVSEKKKKVKEAWLNSHLKYKPLSDSGFNGLFWCWSRWQDGLRFMCACVRLWWGGESS